MKLDRSWRPLLAALLALALVAPAAAQAEGEDALDDLAIDLVEVSVWGMVTARVETDPEAEAAGEIVGFDLNTDEGETYEIVMDDLGRRLAQESSDREDLLCEVEGTLSADETLITISSFALHFVDPYDESVLEEE